MRTKLLFALSLASCSPLVMVSPDKSTPSAAASQGLRLAVLNEPWRGEPHDLPTHLLPVPVEVHNGGPSAVDISLGDFVLIDERGIEVFACLVDQVLGEEPAGTPLPRGPLLASALPPASADPDRQIALRGTSAPALTSDALRMALPQGTLSSGASQRGFLFFQIEDLGRPRPLRLRWRAHQTGSATLLGEIELRLRIGRYK